jgi:hypothetical protein
MVAKADIVIAPDIEAPQPFEQMAGDLANRGMASVPVGCGKVAKPRWSCAGERDLQVNAERIIV